MKKTIPREQSSLRNILPTISVKPKKNKKRMTNGTARGVVWILLRLTEGAKSGAGDPHRSVTGEKKERRKDRRS